jgi:hypothetical protein
MGRNHFDRSYKDAYLTSFEAGYAKASAKMVVKSLTILGAYSITGGEKKIPRKELANCPWLEEGLLDLVTGAVELGLAEGKLIAVASLGRKGHPNIQLDDGTKITDEEIIKFNECLPF